MKIIQESNEQGIIFKVSGRVDAVTSADLQKEMLQAYAKTKNLTMDFSEVEYVSSAGLRVFLMAHKTASSKGGTFVMANVNQTVMNILDTVGFSSVLTIV